MDGLTDLLSQLDLIGGVLFLVVLGWTGLTIASGFLRHRFNFLALALQFFGLLYLVRDVILPNAEALFGAAPTQNQRDLLTVALIISAAFVFDRLWRHFVWEGAMVAGGGAPAPSLLRGAFTALVLLAATGIVAGWVYGQSVTGLLAASGVAAIVVGYAAQSTLSDLLAGIAMSIAPAFRVGDILDIDGDWVKVIDQNWRATETERIDGRKVYYPNSLLANRAVVTMPTDGAPLRRGFTFYADNSVPPELVRDVAVNAAKQSRLCLPGPEPKLWIAGHEAYGYECTLYYYPDWNSYIDAQTEITNLVWYAFRRAGIAFGYNRQHLYVTDWEHAERSHPSSLIESGGDQEAFRAACEGTRELAALDPDGVERLFKIARPRVLGRYERLMKAGETDDTLFLLTTGALAVHIPTGDTETRVATLPAPALAGFMAVMLGAPRSATLTAEAACQVYEIAAADFAGLTADRPDLAERLATLSAEMALENEASREEVARSAVAEADRLQQLKAMFAQRLRDLLASG